MGGGGGVKYVRGPPTSEARNPPQHAVLGRSCSAFGNVEGLGGSVELRVSGLGFRVEGRSSKSVQPKPIWEFPRIGVSFWGSL